MWSKCCFLVTAGTQPSASSEPEQRIDYDFAQQELMMKELSNDPIQEAICAIEKQYEEDKQGKKMLP